jgi:hypothetical protein
MNRREFIAGLGGAATWPVVARGQQQAMPVVGGLYSGPAQPPRLKEAFLQGLREQGYSDSRNVTIEDRFADNQYDRLPALASDLVGRRVCTQKIAKRFWSLLTLELCASWWSFQINGVCPLFIRRLALYRWAEC